MIFRRPAAGRRRQKSRVQHPRALVRRPVLLAFLGWAAQTLGAFDER
jgi:hypothetical protein